MKSFYEINVLEGRINGPTDRMTDRPMEKQTHGWTDRKMDPLEKMDRPTDRPPDRPTDQEKNGQIDRQT